LNATKRIGLIVLKTIYVGNSGLLHAGLWTGHIRRKLYEIYLGNHSWRSRKMDRGHGLKVATKT